MSSTGSSWTLYCGLEQETYPRCLVVETDLKVTGHELLQQLAIKTYWSQTRPCNEQIP